MKTARQYMTEYLISFGKMYQLNRPEPEYIETIQRALRTYGWKVSDFQKALKQLLQDDSYAELARFGKYPTIHDFLRVKQRLDSKPFYDALSAYLAGAWWEKETLLALATPAQSNALLLAGGLKNLYARATGDMSIPVYKLLDIVATKESENPTEPVDFSNRIGTTSSLQQITEK